MARISDCAVEAKKMTKREEIHPEKRESFMAASVLKRAYHCAACGTKAIQHPPGLERIYFASIQITVDLSRSLKVDSTGAAPAGSGGSTVGGTQYAGKRSPLW